MLVLVSFYIYAHDQLGCRSSRRYNISGTSTELQEHGGAVPRPTGCPRSDSSEAHAVLHAESGAAPTLAVLER